MERSAKYDPNGSYGKLVLALGYAQVGRIKEAWALFDDVAKKLAASMKKIRLWISG